MVPRGIVLCALLPLLVRGHDAETFFCNTYTSKEDPSDKSLQFSKAVNGLDYGHQHEYKALHCCFRNFHTTKWYRNGTELLTPAGNALTSFRFSENNNQSLVSHRLEGRDQGNYTCVASDGVNTIRHSVFLRVNIHDEYEGAPVFIIEPQDQYAEVGATRSFTCEAFVGFGKKDIILSSVLWMRADVDFKFIDTSVAKTKCYDRQNGEIKGCILTFDPVTPEAFHTYRCQATNSVDGPVSITATLIEGEDPHIKVRHTYKMTLVILAVFTVVASLLVFALSYWRLEVRLLLKDRLGKLEENDDKLYDVFVCYDQQDAEFVLSVLVPVLEDQCGYRCFAWERDSLAGDWIPETYTSSVRQSRRFLMVLSPALANNSWCTYALYVAIDAMLSLHSRIICILLEDIEWGKLTLVDGNPDNPTLRQVTRVVRTVKWEEGVTRMIGTRKFWHKLRLYLPPRRRLPLYFQANSGSVSSINSLVEHIEVEDTHNDKQHLYKNDSC